MMLEPAYILDTHILIWLAYQPQKLSVAARAAIETTEDRAQQLAISGATLYEVAWLVGQNRLSTLGGSTDLVGQVLSRFMVVPIDSALALAAAQIPTPFHGDPMDRLIVATAIQSNLTLITADRRIFDANLCKLLW